MSVWQYFAYAEGWVRAHESQEGLTKEEADDLFRWINEGPTEIRSSLLH